MQRCQLNSRTSISNLLVLFPSPILRASSNILYIIFPSLIFGKRKILLQKFLIYILHNLENSILIGTIHIFAHQFFHASILSPAASSHPLPGPGHLQAVMAGCWRAASRLRCLYLLATFGGCWPVAAWLCWLLTGCGWLCWPTAPGWLPALPCCWLAGRP